MTLCAAALNKDVDAQEWLRKDQNNADSALTKAVSRYNNRYYAQAFNRLRLGLTERASG